MQSFDEKDVSGSKVGSNPAAKQLSQDEGQKEDSTAVEDKVEAVAAAISKDDNDSSVSLSFRLLGLLIVHSG